MASAPVDQVLLVVYFIYGLSFFGLGVALALESGRAGTASEARILWSLAGFGLIHGTHEWLESYLLQARSAGSLLPDWLPSARLALLVASFAALLLFGLLSFQQKGYRAWIGMPLGASLLAVYAAGILLSAGLTYRATPLEGAPLLDGLSRYLLAVPASLLAMLALRAQAVQNREQGRSRLAAWLGAAALGFGLYGLTQLFVQPLAMFPARVLNQEAFRQATHVPIQGLRALLALLITFSMLLATRQVEAGRRRELETAHQERLAALEELRTESETREELRRDLLRHIVLAQEEERGRIARELHDEMSQTLTATSLNLAALEKQVGGQPGAIAILQQLRSLCKQMSQGLYRLVHDLRPAQLDDLGLVPALEYLADHQRASGLEVEMSLGGPARRLDPVVETVLFRVAQEALTNVSRHARTTHASLRLEFRRREILLQISDRGVGFDLSQSFVPPQGWGLEGMRERVEAVGGRLKIESTPAVGTTIEVVVAVYDLIP